MSDPAYPAARVVAPRIRAQFARHVAAAGAVDVDVTAVVPDLASIETLIDAAFWASLRREERYLSKISLALVAPEQTVHPMIFDRSLPLEASALARVAPAVERPGIHLGVWRQGDEFRVWGTTRNIPTFSLVLEVAAAGLLVVKHHRGDVGKFANVAVLEGDQIKMIDELASSLPDCPALLASLLEFDTRSWTGGVSVLVQLAVSMRAHGRGGSLLIVPSAHTDWMGSILNPISYAVSPRFTQLTELVRQSPLEEDERSLWQDQLDEAVQAVAGLTAVDGATILTDQYDLVAFGAKIMRRKGSIPVERVAVTEPIEGGAAAVVSATSLGGTRHFSAAQLVHDQHDVIALVASQDGNFTVFAWSPCQDMVHAHRVETLLL